MICSQGPWVRVSFSRTIRLNSPGDVMACRQGPAESRTAGFLSAGPFAAAYSLPTHARTCAGAAQRNARKGLVFQHLDGFPRPDTNWLVSF